MQGQVTPIPRRKTDLIYRLAVIVLEFNANAFNGPRETDSSACRRASLVNESTADSVALPELIGHPRQAAEGTLLLGRP